MVNDFFDKKHLVEELKAKFYLTKDDQKNYTNQLLENLRKEKHIHLS